MYEELVKELNFAYSDAVCKEFQTWGELMRDAADAIEKLQTYVEFYQDLAEKNLQTIRRALDTYPRWVSVEESLPPANKEVYVTDGEYIARANLLDEVFPGDKPCWSYAGIGEITHWCERIPLPEPLKKDETDYG